MDARILIVALGTLLASTVAITVTDPPATESPFVPGVFIAADALKSLQDQAKTDSNDVARTEVLPKVSKKNDQLSSSQDMNPAEQPNQGYPQIQEPQMNQPMGNTQYMPDQQSSYPNQQLTYPNQQLPYPNQQVTYPNQQLPYPNQQVTYPNQPILNQGQVYGTQPQPYGNQQEMLLMNQQPGYNQQNGLNPQGYVLNNPSYQQPLLNQQMAYNPQGVLYTQQPSYNQQPIMSQQPSLVAQQPNVPLFIANGQLAQPNLVANPNLVGQPTLITNNPGNGALYGNPVQNQGNLYAMIPANGQNMGNSNLGNTNAYFVPVQQMPANTVLLRDTARK